MGGVLLSLYFLLLKWFVIIIKAEEAVNITFPFILNATDMKNFNKTSILRYGFHKTHKCLDFQKTYLCINTCLIRGYDIASADKDCKCTCFKDKLKSKYFGVNPAWKLPTTTIPAWVGGSLDSSEGKFVLVHAHNQEKLKHKINESLLKTNGTAQYGNNSSEEDHNEASSDGEIKNEVTEDAEPGSGDNGIGSGEEHHNETHSGGVAEGKSGEAEGEGTEGEGAEAEGTEAEGTEGEGAEGEGTEGEGTEGEGTEGEGTEGEGTEGDGTEGEGTEGGEDEHTEAGDEDDEDEEHENEEK